MKVICAGLSKTGTKSLSAALGILGYTVYDFFETVDLLQRDWDKVASGKGGKELLQKIYKGIDAAVDLPVYAFWEELVEAFPDAKVVLTVRDNEHDFLKSIIKQTDDLSPRFCSILRALSPTLANFTSWTHKMGDFSFGRCSGKYVDSSSKINCIVMRQNYRRHNAYVMHKCPKEKLLVYNCKQGWEPLCRFLGHPVPDQKFPHRNRQGEMTEEFRKTRMYKGVVRDLTRSFALVMFIVLTVVVAMSL